MSAVLKSDAIVLGTQKALEAAVLGVLLDGRHPAWPTLMMAGVRLDAFTDTTHRLIFYVCQQMAEAGAHIDAQAVQAEAARIRYDDAAVAARVANRDEGLDYDASVLARIGWTVCQDLAAGFAPVAGLAENCRRLVEAQRDRALANAAERFLEMLRAPHAPETRTAMTERLRGLLETPIASQPMLDSLSADELMAAFPAYRPMVIDGLLREGETMNVIASPKTGKSWLVCQLAYALANGVPWLNRETARGPVLIIDNELHRESAAQRLRAVGAATGLSAADIRVVSLRGRLEDLPTLRTRMVTTAKRMGARAIILDALYRMIPSATSENDNAAMMHLYNGIDRIAEETGAAILCVHHSSKGDQSGKSVTDAGAGAGAISRAADTHVILRQHETEGQVVVDAVARSWPPPAPCVVQRRGVLWTLVEQADPTRLAGRKPSATATRVTPEQLAERVPDTPARFRQIAADANATWGASNEQVRRLLALAVRDGLLHESVGERGATLYSRHPVAPQPSAYERVRAYLQDYPSASTDDVAEACETNPTTVRRVRKQLAGDLAGEHSGDLAGEDGLGAGRSAGDLAGDPVSLPTGERRTGSPAKTPAAPAAEGRPRRRSPAGESLGTGETT